MMTRLAIGACAAMMLLVGACSQSAAEMSDAELRDALMDTLTSDDTFSATEAGCVVDYLFDNTNRDQLNRMADAQDDADFQDQDVTVLTDAVFECLV